MKSKKLFLLTVILVVSVLAIAVCAFAFGFAKKPTITEGEFPFSITYELDGETVTISDVYKTRYDRNDGYADSKSRVYVGEIGDMGEGTTHYVLKQDADGRVELLTHFYADYMMGDAEYDYFDEDAFAPKLYYYDSEEQEYDDAETLAAHGVKLIGFEYPKPIENTFVFSHISHLSGVVVIPTMFIALLCFLAIVIFVKKDNDVKSKVVDIVSIVLNVLVCLVFLPFVTIAALLIDVEGGGPEFYYQALHFIPSLTMLCLAASFGLRRKGYAKTSLIVALVGPIVFAVNLAVSYIMGVL